MLLLVGAPWWPQGLWTGLLVVKDWWKVGGGWGKKRERKLSSRDGAGLAGNVWALHALVVPCGDNAAPQTGIGTCQPTSDSSWDVSC